jgi:hypothetical protein
LDAVSPDGFEDGFVEEELVGEGVIEMSTRNLAGVKRGRRVRLTTYCHL